MDIYEVLEKCGFERDGENFYSGFCSISLKGDELVLSEFNPFTDEESVFASGHVEETVKLQRKIKEIVA